MDALTSSENSAFQVQRAEISKLQGRKAEKEGEITRLKQELSNLQVQQSAIISDTASQDIKNANLKALHPQILAAKIGAEHGGKARSLLFKHSSTQRTTSFWRSKNRCA